MRNEIIIALLAGALSFLGAIGGTWFSAHLDKQRDAKQFKRELVSKLLEKRFETIERCAKNRVATKRYAFLKDQLKLDVQRIKSAKNPNENLEAMAPKIFSYDMQKELEYLKNEHFLCLQMANTFFGSRTVKAAVAVNSLPQLGLGEEKSPALDSFYQAMLDDLPDFYNILNQ